MRHKFKYISEGIELIESNTDKELIISGLSEILGVSESYLREKCERDTLYAAVKARVGKDIVEEVTAFATNNGVSRCIFVEEDVTRKYPALAAAFISSMRTSRSAGSCGCRGWIRLWK